MQESKNGIIYLFEEARGYPLNIVKDNFGRLFVFFQESGLLTIKNNTVKFSYVGIAANPKNVFCFLPKYLHGKIEEEEYIHQSKQVIKVLKEYESNIQCDIEDTEFYNLSASGQTSEIVIADFLLNDYMQHGLWTHQQNYLAISDENEILWDYTIENTEPLISKFPHYFDTFSIAREVINSTLISRIHEWAVFYTYNRYADILDIDIELSNNMAPTVLEDLGETDLLLATIYNELRITFNDRNINILKALAKLIKAGRNSDSTPYSLYGKNKFEHVWEEAVGFCFRNEYRELSAYISRPLWKDHNNTSITEKSTVRPDVIKWLKNEEASILLIADAKYYLFEFNAINQRIENNPGVGDIVKQYFYEFILKRNNSFAPWLQHPTEYLNVLVFPKPLNMHECYRISGSVHIEQAYSEKSIINIYLNTEIIFANYIKRVPFDNAQIFSLVQEILLHR